MTTATELLSAWRGLSPLLVDEAAKKAALAGCFVRWPLIPIDTASGPFKGVVYVASSYFAVGDENDFLTLPLSPLAAQEIADAYGWSLPTKKLVDLIWDQAGVQVEPITWGPPYDASMLSLTRFAAHDMRVKAQLAGYGSWQGQLCAGMKKDVVLTNRLISGRVAIYGWHKLTGEPIQGLNSTSHEDTYADYSHGIRFISNTMLVNGTEMKVTDVLSSPEMCGLLSDDGVLRVLRQPPRKTNTLQMPVVKEATMQIGSTGAQVKEWQAFLNLNGFKDPDGIKLKEDGSYGARTAFATKNFQIARALGASGQVDGPTLKAASDMGFGNHAPVTIPEGKLPTTPPPSAIKFVQAKNYTPANRTKCDVVIFHTMESPDKPDTAENVAAWFAGPNAPQASAHFCVDSNSVVQCVKETDVAWHAPGANHNGIGIEHAGYASQTAADWASEYNQSMLILSARLVADICRRWNIPTEKLSPADLKAGKRGIAGHIDVTNAFNGGKGHTDPGSAFIWSEYIAMVKAA